ncbi:MAG: glucosamine-6-phosphate deaminase [Caldilineaceae bacterium]
MRMIVTKDYAEMSRAAADFVTDFTKAKPNATLVLPTGDSPLGLYRELIARQQQGVFDPSHLRIFQLDEYLGVAPDDERSLYGWVKRAFLDPLHIPPGNVVRLVGDVPDPAAACRAYHEAVLAAGGLDLALLGLGPNGHLGYNDPPADAASTTRVLNLTESSLQGAARYFGGLDRVPRQALTCGMDLLLGARQKLLIVSGAHKREILRQSLIGPLTPEVPASYLQQASAVTIIADEAALDPAVRAKI